LSAGGWLAPLAGQVVRGYEIHMGHTAGGSAWLEIDERNGQPVSLPDGAISEDGRVWGCYMHGIFENEAFRRAWLASLGWDGPGSRVLPTAGQEAAFERLADEVEAALDMKQLEAITWGA
jgi:adenosylcobyric acid synthase